MFQAPKLTNAGKALYYANIGGQGISFTTIKLGRGNLSTAIANLTDLVDTVVTIEASLTNNGDGTYVAISGTFTNTDITTGFDWREIGVFAADPNHPNDRSCDILYCYQNAYDTADFIPAASIETVEKSITVPLIVGDAGSVSCLIDPSLVYATRRDIQNLQEKITGESGQVVLINSQGDAEAQTVDFGLKPRLSVFTESGAVVTVSGNGDSFTKTSTGAVLDFDLPGYGTYTAVATKGSKTSNSVSMDVDTVQIYEVTLTFFTATITVTVTSGSTVTCTKSGVTQTKTSTGTVVFTVAEAGTYTLRATKDGEEAEDTATITSNGQSVSVTLAYVHVYGVQWDGTSSSTWSRTDKAAGFTNPEPAVNNGTGSSPFDNLMPWSGMQKVTDSAAGTLVSIPKYWYKWTRSGSTMKLQIADKATAGFSVSPAHQDRGDGFGEREIVYVGRYHCNDSYKSQTDGKPKADITISVARNQIHNLGSTIWQFDFAMLWTIYMLYLVEFADWDSQKVIGNGCGNNISTEQMGATDTMQYHTGTVGSSRTTYCVGCQYRWIEDLWGNVYDWVDGIRFDGSTVYCFKTPASYSTTTGGTEIGSRPQVAKCISAWSNPSADGFEWALYPSSLDGSQSTYVCDYCSNGNGDVMRFGGAYSQSKLYGLFCMLGNSSFAAANDNIGCRLQKLP